MNCFQRDSRLSILKTLPVAAFLVVIAAMTIGVAQPAFAQTYTVLHDFTGGADGAFPHQIIEGSDGNFYGTASSGGASDHGNIFEITPSGAFTVLYSFTGGADGCQPGGPVFRDSNGDIYGTTHQCADPKCHCGAFFKLDTNNVLTVLHTFTRGADGKGANGEFPSNNLVSVNGALYGTTQGGGSNGAGLIYKITKTGHYTVVQNFSFEEGQGTQGDLTRDAAGNIYGETSDGGSGGTIFKLDTAGNYTVLHGFTSNDGAGPVGRLLIDADGTLTGVSEFGLDETHTGLIWRLETDGTVKALHRFSSGPGGYSPETGLIDLGGTLYGATTEGGANVCVTAYTPTSCGVLYQISKTGVYTVVHSWNGTDGGSPLDELTKGTDGSIYGITTVGGTGGGACVNSNPSGCGVIFKYTPASE